MENLGKLFGKVLAGKKIAGISKGYMVQSIINKFLAEKKIKAEVKVKIVYDVLILKAASNSLKHFLFVNKKILFQQINHKLEAMKLGKIKDIKIL